MIATLATLDRNAYLLNGSTEQIEHNPQMYAAWLNGMIYVDRMDKASRKAAVQKMLRILNSGSSVFLFPEGGWNNSENLLVNPLFSSPYTLAKETGKKVIPLSVFNEMDSKVIFIRANNPVDISNMDKKSALSLLRDQMATMVWEQMEAHTRPLVRKSLTGDIHTWWLEARRREYLRVKWTKDVWEEELTVYAPVDTPAMARAYIDKVHVDIHNAGVVADTCTRRELDRKCDLVGYMKTGFKATLNNMIKTYER